MIERPAWMKHWYDFAAGSIRLLGHIFWRVHFTGRENVPAEGALIVASNHQSHLDPPLVGSGFPRRLNFVARKSLYRFSPFGALIRSLDAIPVDQDGSPLAGLRESLRRLKGGEALLIFPEGSRSWDGEIAPFLPGFALLSRKSNATILPTAIEGAYDAWPRWQKAPRTGTVHIHFGVPMPPDEARRYSDGDLAAELERRVRRLHEEVRLRSVFARRTLRREPPTPEPPHK